MGLSRLVDAVFIDLKKAFDTLDLSFQQVCTVNGVDSKIGDIEIGVPQGSCLGHLLFLTNINDLPQSVPE